MYKIIFQSVPSAIRQYEIRHLSSYYAFIYTGTHTHTRTLYIYIYFLKQNVY
jgi:hypothetical protein